MEVNKFYLFTLTGKPLLKVRKLMHKSQDFASSVLTTQTLSCYRILLCSDYVIFHLTFLTTIST